MNGKWRGISGCGSTRKKSRKRHIRIAGTSRTQISRCSSSQHIYMQLSRIPRMRNQGKFENKGQSLPRQDKGSHHWDIMAGTERAGALRHQLRQTVDKYSERWDRMERQKITIMVNSWRVQQDIQSQNIFPKDDTMYDKNSISRFPCPLSPQGTLTRHRSWCLHAGKSIWTHAKWCFWVCEHENGIVSECSQFCFKIDLQSQHCWGRKAPWEIIWLSPLLKIKPAKAGCSGLWPAGFWMSPRVKTPQLLCVVRSSVRPPSQ